jgi:hypothetical protein
MAKYKVKIINYVYCYVNAKNKADAIEKAQEKDEWIDPSDFGGDPLIDYEATVVKKAK